MLLIVGLGNPDKEYENTNHNVGFRVLDQVAKNLGIQFEKKEIAQSRVAVIGAGEKRIILAKPLTYMNNSGIAVRGLIKRYNIVDPSQQLVVVSDDFDVAEGTIRIRTKSGNTTHNGIKSIKREIGTNEFIRVKVSIAPKPEHVSVVDFVLSKSINPNIKISEEKAENAVIELINGETIENVMCKFSN